MANPISEALGPFVWGAGGSKKTPEEIARDKEIAAELLMQAGNTSPVGHWTQGAARVVDALGGVLKQRRADAAGIENDTYNQGIISSLLGGGASPAASPVAASIPASGASAEIAATSPGMQSYRDAIAGIESAGSGDYAAIGPTNEKLGRALGRYQIMEANIGPWSQEALGRAVTPDEFMADPALQDAIFDHKFKGYVDQYGPEGAAQAWLGGPGGVGKVDRKDALGTSIGEYGQRFANAIGSPAAAIEAISPTGGSLSDEVATFEQTPAYSAQFPGRQAPAMDPAQEVGPAPVVAGQPMQAEPQAVDGAARVAQALPAAGQPQQAAPFANEAIIRAMTDPRATPQTRAIAQALMQQQQAQQAQAAEQQQWMERQQYEQQQLAADPLRQLQLEKGQIELEQARQPQRQPLINAGNGNVYDPNTESWLQAPGGGEKGFRAASKEEANTFGAAAGQFGPDGRFYPLNPPQGTSLQVDPTTGAVTFNQGAGVKPLTESQSKDAFFTTRMTAAAPTLDAYESALMSLPEAVAGAIPMNLGNYAQSEEYQLARDAGRDFVMAYLRKDSGAALTPTEEKMYGELLLPQPGDKTATVQAKRQRRMVAVEAIKSGMPPSAVDGVLKAINAVPGADQPQNLVPTDIPNVVIRRKVKE